MLTKRRQTVEGAPGSKLPDPASEDSDGYEAAIQTLRNKTRDHSRFRLVFEENRNYGYERNLLSVRALGICTSIVILAASACAALLVANHRGSVTLEFPIGLVSQLAIVIFWAVVPSEQRTRTVAFKYAERLIDAAESLV